MSKSGLGKGLSALIAEKPVLTPATAPTVVASTRDTLPLNKLRAGKYQPRTKFSQEELQELAESIKKNGVVQPILVRKAAEGEMFEIIAGERRWRAANLAKLESIPAIIMEVSDQQAAEVALVENVQRKDLNMLEEAEGYQRLIDEFHYTQEQLAEVIGKSRSQITNTLRLLALPEKVKKMVAEDRLSGGHARAILAAPDPIAVAEVVAKRDLNVRQTEKLVKKMSETPRIANRKPTLHDPELKELEQEICERLGLELTVTNKGHSGKIVISYHSIEELDSILRRLAKA